MQAPQNLLKKYRVEIQFVLAGALVVLVFIIVQRVLLNGQESSYLHFIGAPLDDVFIHTRFAENLIHGHSFSFNPGETLSADTSPLWVLLVAFGGLFTMHLELVSIFISIIAYLALAPGVYRIAKLLFELPERFARLAGWSTLLAGRLAWSGMSGMETSLAVLLMLLVVEEHVRGRKLGRIRSREGVWLGVAIALRPEFLLVAFVLALDWSWAAWRSKADCANALFAAVLALIIPSPVFLLPLVTRGGLISHSSVVQSASMNVVQPFDFLVAAVRLLIANNIVLFCLFAAGLALFIRSSERFFHPEWIAPLAILIGLPIAQAIVAAQVRHHGRYLFPVIPLVILFGVFTWSKIVELYNIRPIVRKLIPALIILAAIAETGRWAFIEASDARNINDQHLAVVNWLGKNMTSGDKLAVDDVGAIGYFLDKPLIDLTGLMTPKLWPMQHDQDSVWRFARARGANLFVIYRRLAPAFYGDHRDSLMLASDFPVRLPLTSAADTVMSIYRLRNQ